MNDIPSFDLTTEPWIRVRRHDGTVGEVSLLDALVQAEEYAGLAGEVATQDVAALRLLLAVVRRCLPDARTPGDWEGLWNRRRFADGAVRSYLDRHRDRFDLLHPETPFYQVAGLHTAKGEMTELARLIVDVPAGHKFFTTRTGAGLRSMSLAEAARWLLHTQAWDSSGIRSGVVGDDRAKGGKSYPIGVAWCGWLGVVLVEGGNLFETLLLNLSLGRSIPAANTDLPVWERPAQGPGVEIRDGAPTGPVDLLTWQSRRVLIGHDGARAVSVLISNGDPLHPRDRFREEYMCGWRRSEAQEKALKRADPVFMPRTHPPERAVWRGLGALLTPTDSSDRTRGGRWMEWLTELRQARTLPRDFPLRLRTIGIEYGTNSSVVDDLQDDRLLLPIEVLANPLLKATAIGAVEDVDAAVRVLGQLAHDLARASGADLDLCRAHRTEARELGYADLDHPYRQWLARLEPAVDRDLVRADWQAVVRATALRLGRRLLDDVSDVAWAGLPGGPDGKPVNAATAANWFHLGLAKALPENKTETDGMNP
ncbi:type I-E CRISPR-associated protein Cse1/CasA [Nocardioides hungaricus]